MRSEALTQQFPTASVTDDHAPIRLRRIPYPYKAMLAICSDLDGTSDRRVYWEWEIMRFLNTTEMSSMGRGVGLEVGNSIHFRAIPPQFSCWDTDDAGHEMVRTLIRSGHIDCLHTFGELVYTRDEAKRVLDFLATLPAQYAEPARIISKLR